MRMLIVLIFLIPLIDCEAIKQCLCKPYEKCLKAARKEPVEKCLAKCEVGVSPHIPNFIYIFRKYSLHVDSLVV